MKTNTQTITREFVEQNILFFYPATAAAAQAIMEKLFNMGVLWGKQQTRDISSYTHDAVTMGIVVIGYTDRGNKPGLYTANGDIDWLKEKGLLCKLSDFDAAPPLPIPQVMQEIKALRAEMTLLRQDIALIKEAVLPQTIKKDGPDLKR